MKKKIIAAGIVLAVLLVVIGLVKNIGPGDTAQRRALTAEVKKGPLVITVKGSGTIQAVNPNKIIPLIKRQAVITFLAPEGSRVAKDEVIARLNVEEIERDINNKETTLIKAQNDLDAARTALEIQQMDNVVNLAKAEQELVTAELELEKFLQADEPVDVRGAELDIQTAQSDLGRAQDAYRDYQDLFKESFVTQDDVEEKRMDLEKKKVGLETARIKLTVLQEYGLPVREAAAQGRLDGAKAAFEKTRKENETQFRRKNQELEVAQMSLARAEKDLAMVREEKKAYEIKAPVSGIVNYGDPDEWWRRRDIQVGGNMYPGRAFLNIPDMSAVQAVVVILEADIAKIKVGQKATITVEALAGKTLHGEVKKVPEVANRGSWLEGNQFKVEIVVLDGKDLKTFSCDAEIVTETIEAAIYLPVPAVFREGDRYVVYPVKGGGKKKVEVAIGRASIADVEILSGVEPGLKVLLIPPEMADEKK